MLGTLHNSKWHYGNKYLLLGDSAHAMTPFYWQGLNCSFRNILILDRSIDKVGSFNDGLFGKYCDIEIKNSEIMAKLSVERFKELADRVSDP